MSQSSFFVVCSLLASLVSCSNPTSSDQESIFGTWNLTAHVDETNTPPTVTPMDGVELTFRTDGTVTMGIIESTWTKTDGLYYFEYTTEVLTSIYSAQVVGNEIHVRDLVAPDFDEFYLLFER